MPTPETMTIVTRPCMVCMKASHVEVTRDEYLGYMVHGMLIQDAMPTRSVDFREVIITGTHPECWTAMFGDEDDDDEPECEGHADGPVMGETFYCDGSCA